MAKVRVLILRAAGINCEVETAHAWELAGASPEIVHLQELRTHSWRLRDYQILTIPGGFSYGDDIAAGKIFANQLQVFLADALQEFRQLGGLILGICNGFQVLCKAGLLPGQHPKQNLPAVTITDNLCRKYEDRWVRLHAITTFCAFLKRREQYELPLAHGEGRIVTGSPADVLLLHKLGIAALQYVDEHGSATQAYPANPNGSMGGIAGLCDASGRVFGLMPHPERFIDVSNHPEWTSRTSLEPHGLDIFRSAVESLQ
ncbi:MAG: Phosphoribosylformylglycinamidine synthase [Phycisphaerae bacterium]|nr:Phosphoribosylformylglycinamidine synthase [Phycisphaerae bacterium]